ncbi:unnamed protein product [Rhodiola kirilowii]
MAMADDCTNCELQFGVAEERRSTNGTTTVRIRVAEERRRHKRTGPAVSSRVRTCPAVSRVRNGNFSKNAVSVLLS